MELSSTVALQVAILFTWLPLWAAQVISDTAAKAYPSPIPPL